MTRPGRLTLGLAGMLAITAMMTPTVPQAAALPRGQVDHLFALLQAAPDEQSAGAIESQLHELWRDAGSPAAKMLLGRGMQEITSNAPDAAAADLDAALTLDSDYIEAYNDRAAARLMQGDYAGAIRDAGEALRREPRQFSSLQTLSRVAEARGDWKSALEAWQKVLAIDPHIADGQSRLNLLRRNAEGEAT